MDKINIERAMQDTPLVLCEDLLKSGHYPAYVRAFASHFSEAGTALWRVIRLTIPEEERLLTLQHINDVCDDTVRELQVAFDIADEKKLFLNIITGYRYMRDYFSKRQEEDPGATTLSLHYNDLCADKFLYEDKVLRKTLLESSRPNPQFHAVLEQYFAKRWTFL